MPTFVFRTVKSILIENSTLARSGLLSAGNQNGAVLSANERTMDVEDETPEILDYIASVLMAAEACLMLNTQFLFVSIFKLEIGEKIDTATPMKVCFRTDMTAYTNENSFYPITRYERKSDNWFRAYEESRLKPLLANDAILSTTNPYNRNYTVDPFIGVIISQNCVTGRNHQQCFKGCLDETDYYWDTNGVLHLVESSNFVNCRFPDYENTMRVLYPFFSNRYLDAEGVLREGPFIYSQLLLSCPTDLKAQRRAWRSSAAMRSQMGSTLDHMMFILNLQLPGAERYATQRKDLFIYNAGDFDNYHPYFYVLQRFLNVMITWKGLLIGVTTGEGFPLYRGNNYSTGGQPANVVPWKSDALSENARVILNLIQNYIDFIDAKKWPQTTPWTQPQFTTSPHANMEPAPAGANFSLPFNFDADKWTAFTYAGASEIYNNWEATFRTLELSMNILALIEKFICHMGPGTREKRPRYFARAVATRDPKRLYPTPHFLIPSRAVSGLLDPTTVPNNLKPINTTTTARIYKATPLACPTRAPFWMPRCRSIILDRSGYDARLRRWLTEDERRRMFPRPQDIVIRSGTEPHGGSDLKPPQLDVSDRRKNCDDLRVQASTTTILGNTFDFSFNVPKPVVTGLRNVLGNNAYLTPDCSQRKALDFKLPTNLISSTHITTGS